MQFSPETQKWLLDLKKQFPDIAQKIFEQYYLQPFDGKQKDNLYQLPVERVSHGAQHASRVALYIPILVNYFRDLGYPQGIIDLSEEEIVLLQLAALFHDAARHDDKSKDTTEKNSAELFQKYLQDQNIQDQQALDFCQYITRSKHDFLNHLLQTADSLDIMRAKDSLQLEKTNLFYELEKKDHASFLELAKEIRAYIAFQHDLKLNCSIKHEETILVDAIPATRDPNQPELKQQYEQADRCYLKIKEDLDKFKLLKKYYHNNKLLPETVLDQSSQTSPISLKDFALDDAQIFSSGNECYLYFLHKETAQNTLETIQTLLKQTLIHHEVRFVDENYRIQLNVKEWKSLENALRKSAPILKPTGDYYLKSIRADTKNYFYQFVDMLFHGIKYPLSDLNKKTWTVTGSGVYKRDETVADGDPTPIKKPQYTKEEKENYTKSQSSSLGLFDFFVDVFGFTKRKDKLVGVLIDEKDVLLSDRLFIYDGGTYDRPFDFYSLKAAMEYFKRKVGTVLFSKDKLAEFKNAIRLHPDSYNEVLTRLSWNCDGSSKVFIYSDNLESRLLAQEYAAIILDSLKKAGKCPPGYQVPICFYHPKKLSQLFKEYTPAEQALDRATARLHFADKTIRLKKIKKSDYEFLLALKPEHAKAIIKEKIDGESLLLKILADGYVHIFKSLLKNLNLSVQEALDDLWPDYSCYYIAKLLPDILSHCLRCDEESLATYIYEKASYEPLIHVISEDKKLPFWTAAEKGKEAWVEKLLTFNITYDDREKLVMLAALNGHTKLLASLLKEDIYLTQFGKAALVQAFNKKDDKMIKMLVEMGLSLEEPMKKSDSILMQIANSSDVEKAELCLKYTKNINIQNKKGESPLMIAVKNGHHDMVQLFLKKQANLDIRDKEGYTALAQAVSAGYFDIVKELITHGADVNAKMAEGNTALICAADASQMEVLIYLLECGAETNIKGRNGNTALYRAVLRSNIAIAKILLEHGENVNATNDNGKTPLMVAAEEGHLELVKLLLKHGADINLKSSNDFTALDYAAHKGHQEITKLLLELGTKSNYLKNKVTRFIINMKGHKGVADLFKMAQKADVIKQEADKLSHNEKIACQIANLFDRYANPPLFTSHSRPNKEIAAKIAKELKDNTDWDYQTCEAFIQAQVEELKKLNPKFNTTGTFAGLLHEIKILGKQLETQQPVNQLKS